MCIRGRCWRACRFGSPRLPVAGAHVTPLEGGSPVGGHGDVFSGGSPWTVTCPSSCMICLSCSYHRCVSTFRRRQLTRLGLTGMLNILIGILALVPTRASGSLASLSVGFTSLDHCIDTLSATARGGSLVRTRLSVRVTGSFRVLFLRCTPGDTTLSELRQAEMLFKVGTLSYNWSTIGQLAYEGS